MNVDELIIKIQEINKILPSESSKWNNFSKESFFITTIQFVKNYIGVGTEFYRTLNHYSENPRMYDSNERVYIALEVLASLTDYLKLNLDLNKTNQYNIRVDVICDFLLQAVELSNDKRYHPAASAILMGAALEEFLKRLAESNKLDLTNVKLSIDSISKKLYENELISKQDVKDITSWAGIRNDATHGNFDEVNDRKRIVNAIEGVNLFMRKLNY